MSSRRRLASGPKRRPQRRSRQKCRAKGGSWFEVHQDSRSVALCLDDPNMNLCPIQAHNAADQSVTFCGCSVRRTAKTAKPQTPDTDLAYGLCSSVP